MYTFRPKQKYAKASSINARVSPKSSAKICKVIRNKKLSTAKRLLQNLASRKQDLRGKYYTKSVKEILSLLESCEKNAGFAGLDSSKLFVHASATHGTIMRRRRRKAAHGSRMKTANLEVMLIEKGKESKKKEAVKQERPKEKKETKEGEKSKEKQAEEGKKPGAALPEEKAKPGLV